MTALVAILLQLLFGFGHPAPVVFHDVPAQNGLLVHCTDQGACVPVEGNTVTPRLLPGGEVLP